MYTMHICRTVGKDVPGESVCPCATAVCAQVDFTAAISHTKSIKKISIDISKTYFFYAI